MIRTSGRAAALLALIAARHLRSLHTGIFASPDRCAAQRDPIGLPVGLSWRIAPACRRAAWRRCNACRRTCRAFHRAAKARSARSKPRLSPRPKPSPKQSPKPNRKAAPAASTAAPRRSRRPKAAPRLPKAAAGAPAKKPSSAQVAAVRSACRSDYMAHCSSVPTGGAAALNCLKQNKSKLSASCQQAVNAASGGAAPGGDAAAPAQATPRPRRRIPPIRRRRPPRHPRRWCCGRCGRARCCSCCASACGGDVRALCGGVPPGGGRIVAMPGGTGRRHCRRRAGTC